MANEIKQLDQQLNQQILAGDILGAFDAFYADGVVMQENSGEPTVGKPANRVREEQFVGSIEQFHGGKLLGAAVNGDRSYSEWAWDITFTGGFRKLMEQTAVRERKDGKVAFERFYYNAGN